MQLYISNGCRLASRLAVTSVYLAAERNANLSSRLNGQGKQPLVLQLTPTPPTSPTPPPLCYLPPSLARPPSSLATPTSTWPMGSDGVPRGPSTEKLYLTLVIASNAPLGTAGNCTLRSATTKTAGKAEQKKLK